jgi:hypothetical protein
MKNDESYSPWRPDTEFYELIDKMIRTVDGRMKLGRLFESRIKRELEIFFCTDINWIERSAPSKLYDETVIISSGLVDIKMRKFDEYFSQFRQTVHPLAELLIDRKADFENHDFSLQIFSADDSRNFRIGYEIVVSEHLRN